MLGAVGMMDLAYVCEWEKWAKSTYCPSLPLACAWSCRNLIAFTTDLRNDDQGECWTWGSRPCGWACQVWIHCTSDLEGSWGQSQALCCQLEGFERPKKAGRRRDMHTLPTIFHLCC